MLLRLSNFSLEKIFLNLCNVTLSALCKETRPCKVKEFPCSHFIIYNLKEKNSFVSSVVQITWVCHYGLDFLEN